MTEIIYGLASVVIAIVTLFLLKTVINKKLYELQGSDKLVGLITIAIIISEFVYLGKSFGLFEFAIEAITTIGAAAVVLGIAFQNQLKNTISGISIFVNSQINVGDIIEIDYVKGTIIGIHLTKIIALTDEGIRMVIPNHVFSETMFLVYPKQSKIKKNNYIIYKSKKMTKN
jgi:small-conductance mechanosensitive channel